MFVDDLSHSFLEGSFEEDILRSAFLSATIKPGDEFFGLQPNSSLTLRDFVDPLKEITFTLAALEEELVGVSF